MSRPGRLVRAGDLVPRPWPNGFGVTRDIAGEGGQDGRIGWLLSLADLERDAPFSHLPNCDRVFTLVEGDPVELTIDGAAPVVSRSLVPTHFPGDRPTACRMTGGPGRAFNAFVDRSIYRARASALNLAAGHGIVAEGAVAAAYCVGGGTVAVDGDTVRPGDTWLGTAGATLQAVREPAVLVLIAVVPAG